eukprot:187911_1
MGNCVTNCVTVQPETNILLIGSASKKKKLREESIKIPAVEFAKLLVQHQTAQDQYEYLSNVTHFDENTLRLLHVRFNAIDSSIERDSRISLDEFAKIIQMSPKSILVSRFFKYMDVHNLGLTFRIFATTMSILSREASKTEKIKLSFHLCDLNDDGYIDKNELMCIITDCIQELKPLQINKEQINIIVENTFKKISNVEKNKISFDEYFQFVSKPKNYRLLAPFSLDIDKLIQYEAESRRLIGFDEESMDTKILHHGPLSPEPDNKKIRDYLPSVTFGDKIERVSSIHDALDICADLNI